MGREIRRSRLCILAEGYEEEAYLRKILSFPNRLKEKYEITIINAKGKDKLINRYQSIFQSGHYEKSYIFGDGDNNPNYIKRMINAIADINGDNGEVFIFVNPVTLQIVLSHFAKVTLTKVGKKSNASEVERLTKIKNYSAKKEQVDEMMNKITYKSIDLMLNNIRGLSNLVEDKSSSNIEKYLCFIFNK